MAAFLSRRNDRVKAQLRMLESLSYKNVLKRGYALVRDAAGQPVKAAATVTAWRPARHRLP